MATAESERPNRGGTPVHEAYHGVDGEDTLMGTIIEAIAAAEGVDPTERDLGVYETVDLDALETLFGHRSEGRWQVEFSVADRLVTVESDGRVAVYEN